MWPRSLDLGLVVSVVVLVNMAIGAAGEQMSRRGFSDLIGKLGLTPTLGLQVPARQAPPCPSPSVAKYPTSPRLTPPPNYYTQPKQSCRALLLVDGSYGVRERICFPQY